MGIAWNVLRVILVALIVVTVAEISKRHPRVGALLLSLPLMSILAFLAAFLQHRDLPTVSRLAKETLILVPLGLPFFLPLAFAQRLGLEFWSALALGVFLASVTIGAWLIWAPTD
jgi:hypothetical protein